LRATCGKEENTGSYVVLTRSSFTKVIMDRSPELEWDVPAFAQGGGFPVDDAWIAGKAETYRSAPLREFNLICSHFEDILSGVQNVNTRMDLGDELQRVKELTHLPSFTYHPQNREEPEVIE
jgi:hypothetical protein